MVLKFCASMVDDPMGFRNKITKTPLKKLKTLRYAD